MAHNKRIIIAACSPDIRDRLESPIKSAGLAYSTTASPSELLQMQHMEDDLYIVETGDDIALLMQVVYHLYSVIEDRRGILIIGVASEKAIVKSPAVNFWLIDGQAAVCAVWTPHMITDSFVLRWVHSILSSLEEDE